LSARGSAAQVPRLNNSFIDSMRETVEMIVKALVDDAEAVDVREIEREGATRIEVRVAQTDMGQVIGKQGRTVRALRSVVYAAGLKQHRRFVLDVVE
jgi:predicted RNA-binding protein YlqC (UPF0109 family)